MSLNKVILLGNLGQDPEIQGEGNKQYCRFGLATTESYNGKKETTWHNCVCFGRTAMTISEYFSKGDPILVEGKIKTEKYEGKTSVTIMVFSFSFIGKKKDAEAPAKEEPTSITDDESLPF